MQKKPPGYNTKWEKNNVQNIYSVLPLCKENLCICIKKQSILKRLPRGNEEKPVGISMGASLLQVYFL